MFVATFSVFILLSGLLELVASYSFALAWYRCLPLTLRQDVDLPALADPSQLEGVDGTTDDATWRFLSADRSLLFRRRFQFGRRRTMVAGRIQFDENGGALVKWAPIPLLVWPLVVLTGLGQAVFALVTGDFPAVPPALGMVAVMSLIGGINLLVSRSYLRNSLMPEVELAILDHIRNDARDLEAADLKAPDIGIEGAILLE
jgi:hypothetical protein